MIYALIDGEIRQFQKKMEIPWKSGTMIFDLRTLNLTDGVLPKSIDGLFRVQTKHSWRKPSPEQIAVFKAILLIEGII